jgi:hypothetical protein
MGLDITEQLNNNGITDKRYKKRVNFVKIIMNKRNSILKCVVLDFMGQIHTSNKMIVTKLNVEMKTKFQSVAIIHHY